MLVFPGVGQIPFLQLLGVLGFFLYVLGYTCVSFGLMTSEQIRYYVVNTVAATLVLISLTHEFNLASAMIQTFWIAIGCSAILLRLYRRNRARRLRRSVGQRHEPIVAKPALHQRRPRESVHVLKAVGGSDLA